MAQSLIERADALQEKVIEGLLATKGHWQLISRASGVKYKTIKKIASRETKRTALENLEKLNDVLQHLNH
jgi:phosphopantetheine adenylyltransferase